MSMETEETSPSFADCIATLTLEQTVEEGSEQLGEQLRAQFPIFPGKELRIGRDANLCEPVIYSGIVSKQHLRIYSVIFEEESESENPPLIYCEDLESVNGTWVNDVLIGMFNSPKKAFLLSDGDLIQIKPHWAFRFHQCLVSDNGVFDEVQEAEKQHFSHRYTLEQRILGSGKFGKVCLAYDKFTKTQLACKVVDLRGLIESDQSIRDEKSPEFVKPSLPRTRNRKSFAAEKVSKYMREIDLLCKLSHPNIVSLKRAFRSENTLFLFQELATGGDLFSYLHSQGGVLSDLHSHIISRQVALAIQYLHAQGIAHRDLKPENILVTHTDPGHRIMLTDFGQATYVAKIPNRSMSLFGSIGYQAPEVRERHDDREYTKAIDMWSLGIVATCLLTGDTLVPLSEENDPDQRAVLSRHMEKLHEAEGLWADVGERARDFVKKLLVTDAQERMTADQALLHCWFTGSPEVAIEVKKLYQRANKHWNPQGEQNLVEDIPPVVQTPGGFRLLTEIANPSSKRQKCRHDASASQYFSCDRQLRIKTPSRRRTVLRELERNAPQKFLQEAPRSKHQVHPATSMMESMRKSKFVEGSNLFGKNYCLDMTDRPDVDSENRPPRPFNFAAAETADETTSSPDDSGSVVEIQDSQEGFQIPNPPYVAKPRQNLTLTEEKTQEETQTETQDETQDETQNEVQDSDESTTQGSLELRRLLERQPSVSFNRTQEEQQFFEDAIKEIPPFSSAKLLRDKIDNRRNGS